MRRLTIVVLGISVVGISAALACGFPDVDFAADTEFLDGSFVPSDGSSSGSSGSSGDVSEPPDGGNPDGNPCKGDPVCDCDGDGDLSLACDGGDCDDNDERVRSTQTDFVDAASNRAGDWNCDFNVELEGDGGVVCATLFDAGWAVTATPDQIKTACATEGFVENPGCGELGTYNRCERAGGVEAKSCRVVVGTNVTRPRGCR